MKRVRAIQVGEKVIDLNGLTKTVTKIVRTVAYELDGYQYLFQSDEFIRIGLPAKRKGKRP